MIKNLELIVEEDCALDFCGMKPIEVAEEILSRLENLGMQPPQIEKPITYRSDLNPSLELLTVTKTVNEWEPE